MSILVETERLVLRELVADDTPSMALVKSLVPKSHLPLLLVVAESHDEERTQRDAG